MIPSDYVTRVYSGWYGKLIGIRHGSNIEGWSYEKIAEKYGEIEGYLFNFKNFAADDDSNGPIFFIRALEDYACNEAITPKQMGETILNYVPCEHGFFWWGGYGTSTEHTAYQNLRNGIDAPLSGSIALNGAAVAEQIGGQIFIDTWGLVNPGDYQRAARFAAKMASVTHDGNGVYGGMFVAACVSAAFVGKDIRKIIEIGLSVIPEDCEYRRMANDVIAFHDKHPGNWRDAFAFVKTNYGYDRYPGNCHIIPNSAVVLLSLLYGGGNFSSTINICNMCGWDTDCNVANVGCIMGVMVGLEGIDSAWTAPINDFLACSSVLGCMNLRDVANDALYLASLGYRIAGEAYPDQYRDHMERTSPEFAFVLPRSTHTFRSDLDGVLFENVAASNTAGGRCLNAYIPASERTVHVYRQTYYRPDDFNDNRYSPSFTPEVFPGQDVVLRVGSKLPATIRPYVYDLYSGEYTYGEPTVVCDWTMLRLHIPPSDGCIGQVGIAVEPGNGSCVSIDYLNYEGKAQYTLDFGKAGAELWNVFHKELSQTSNTKGIWECHAGRAYGSCADRAELFTGGRDFKDYIVTAHICPEVGRHHLVCVRVQGAIRGYMAGFYGDELVILKNERHLTKLAGMRFSWENHRDYHLSVKVHGNCIELFVNGEKCIWAEDVEQAYADGCYGFSIHNGSRCAILSFQVVCE